MPLAIFDLDGTLVDLFDIHLAGFKAVVMDRTGLEFKRGDLEASYGKSGEEILVSFLTAKGVVYPDLHALAAERRKWVVDNLDECKTLPGALDLMKGLKDGGFKVGLGTSNTESIGEKIVSAAGISGFFDVKSYRAEGVPGKPAPDIFLNAARLLGEVPGRCVVVEDSTHGIMAARAAGMKSVAVSTGTHTLKELAAERPDLVVSSLLGLKSQDFRRLLGV